MNKDEIIANEQQYVLQTYIRPDFVLTRGQGATLYDTDGRAYLDFNAGIAVSAIGHGDQGWVQAITSQAIQVGHVSNLYHSEPQATLARKLVENSFADRVYFCNSGAEANEAALKFARKYAWEKWQADGHEGPNPRHRVIAFSHSFHGRTMGALAATSKEKYRAPFEPLMPGIVFAEYNDLASVRAVLDETICAILVEPIQGEGGIYPAQKGFLEGLRRLSDETDVLLIFDEVQCGLGRSGYLWAHEMFGVYPDIMCLAKPLAGGLPIGATLVRQKVADAIKPGDHGSTFGANPVACAAANYVFDQVNRPEFLAQIRANSEHMNQRLQEALPADQVVEIRGAGYMIGIEFKMPVGEIVKSCVEEGVLLISAGDTVVRLIPPLIVTTDEIDRAVDTLAAVVKAAG